MNKLYLDLDGVFADFETAVEIHTGSPYNSKTSWQKLDKVPNFFGRLRPLPGAMKLFDLIKRSSLYEVEMLTALPDKTGKLWSAQFDKEFWCYRYLSRNLKVNTTQGWEGKALFARPGNILVDDSFRNIEDWVACGGTGVHHTSNWNTIQELRMLGVLK